MGDKDDAGSARPLSSTENQEIKMRTTTLAPLLALAGAASASASTINANLESRGSLQRILASEDEQNEDDDFWLFDNGSNTIVWNDYALEAKTCMIL